MKFGRSLCQLGALFGALWLDDASTESPNESGEPNFGVSASQGSPKMVGS